MQEHKFPFYKNKFPFFWQLANGYPAKGVDYHGTKVFGTFICGGGSTMGYKLAGFNHLGGVELDPKVAEIYITNHSPQFLYNEDIRKFNERTDLPDELYNLDMLDGSPPCSSFSMAGNREEDWGKEKQFKEGQALQVLDDLVFVYIDTIAKLKPKVALLENVKGLLQGNARSYAKKIVDKLQEIGYDVQVFLLNGASVGLPQKRERVFFIAHRKELNFPKLCLEFDDQVIPFNVISDNEDQTENLTPLEREYWNKAKPGEPCGKFNSTKKVNGNEPLNTITASVTHYHYKYARKLNNCELGLGGSFPKDYDFKKMQPRYLIGMSVPPVMTAQIANQIYLQWFKNENICKITNDGKKGKH